MTDFLDRLTPWQREVLSAFFEREQGFYLTGGAALVGYHIGHRETLDLDLFTTDAEAFERGRYVLTDLAAALGAELSIRQDAPGFRRVVLTRDGEGLVVDLVIERVPQATPTKLVIDGVRVDPVFEILANKLCAVVGRAEERDIVDLWALEQSGLRVEDALDAALQKDGGCTPATLAWLLSQVEIRQDAKLPGGVSPRILADFVSDLVDRLRKLAHPG